MKVRFEQGKIIAEGRYHEEAKYDLSNELIAVTTDGLGGLTRYRVGDQAEDCIGDFLSLDLAVHGERLSPYLSKKVEMVGRMQIVTIDTPDGDLSVTTFLAPEVNGVFYLLSGEGFPFGFSVNCRSAKGESAENVNRIHGENFLLSSSVSGDWVAENDCFYAFGKERVCLLLTFSGKAEEHDAAFLDFERYYREAVGEIKGVTIPSSAKTEEEKAMYLSAYFTAVENHKTFGEFRAFAAGVDYLNPVRTYYRDSYFTMLPLYDSHPDWIRDEILTLARGVTEEGGCPSAVKTDFTAFWGDHYDSPAFFVMQIADYVRNTGDKEILRREIGGVTLLKKARAVMDRLLSRADQTGLLPKDGAFNKRDWADEVNRSGYVTFVQLLFYRALCSAEELFRKEDPSLAAIYRDKASVVKEAINAILFDEEKGYYVNYKSADFVEDNLSVDTVFALLFGVAEGERAERMLDRMESLLETRNNPTPEGENFGVMCVFPPYRDLRACCHKSARLFDYHNGANWCYLTAIYAYAKYLFGRDYRVPLLDTFRYMIGQGQYTFAEYFSPCCKTGSSLQGWSAAVAFVWSRIGKKNFFE